MRSGAELRCVSLSLLPTAFTKSMCSGGCFIKYQQLNDTSTDKQSPLSTVVKLLRSFDFISKTPLKIDFLKLNEEQLTVSLVYLFKLVQARSVCKFQTFH